MNQMLAYTKKKIKFNKIDFCLLNFTNAKNCEINVSDNIFLKDFITIKLIMAKNGFKKNTAIL